MNFKSYKFHIPRILVAFFFLCSILYTKEINDFKYRVSFLNIGLDVQNQFNIDNFHRSILLVPILFERGDLGFGVYANPFLNSSNNLGYEQFGPLIDSYLVNFRLRYYKPFWKDVKLAIDLAHADGNLYKWKDIVISWLEIGFNYKLNYSSQLFLGYRYILNSNDSSIDFNGIYFNLIFGHSFLRR